MIALKDVKLGLQQYGPSAGHRAIFFTVERTENYEETEEQHIDRFKKMVQKIKQDIGPAPFEDFLSGDMTGLFQCDGDDVTHPAVREELYELIQGVLTQEALNHQLSVLGRKQHEVRPPFTTIITKGSTYTGQDMFLEGFNVVLVEPDLAAELKPFALIEAAKHRMSSFVFKIEQEADWDFIKEKILDAQYAPPQMARVWLVPANASVEKFCAQTALSYGVRYATKVPADLANLV